MEDNARDVKDVLSACRAERAQAGRRREVLARSAQFDRVVNGSQILRIADLAARPFPSHAGTNARAAGGSA
jgi:hypothetical protein